MPTDDMPVMLLCYIMADHGEFLRAGACRWALQRGHDMAVTESGPLV